VPVYRQIIDQIAGGVASGTLQRGQQLPTVRQLAVDLSVNPNTVIRAYRELEIRGVLVTQQGLGTFIGTGQISRDEREHQRALDQLVTEVLARAGHLGFHAREVLERLESVLAEGPTKAPRAGKLNHAESKKENM
jgi:DNA-binding transcriptional regulator YhcF (GntR family)